MGSSTLLNLLQAVASVRLQSDIWSPKATDGPACVFHYTSVENAKKILEEKIIWALRGR
jgi:hypothetical protein